MDLPMPRKDSDASILAACGRDWALLNYQIMLDERERVKSTVLAINVLLRKDAFLNDTAHRGPAGGGPVSRLAPEKILDHEGHEVSRRVRYRCVEDFLSVPS